MLALGGDTNVPMGGSIEALMEGGMDELVGGCGLGLGVSDISTSADESLLPMTLPIGPDILAANELTPRAVLSGIISCTSSKYSQPEFLKGFSKVCDCERSSR